MILQSKCSNSKEGLQSDDDIKKKCPITKIVYTMLDNLVSKFDPKTFYTDNNHAILNATCKIGNDVVSRCNKNNLFMNPLNSPIYIKYCCNGNPDTCNIGSDCMYKKAKLTYESNNYKNLNEADISGSTVTQLKSFCQSGKNIIDNKCVIDDIHPLNNDVYKHYCCKDSICGPENIDGCVTYKSDFLRLLNDTKNRPPGEIGTVETGRIKQMCQSGININTDGCIGVNPIYDETFRAYCCNDSGDVTKCSVNNADSYITERNRLFHINESI